MRKFSVEFGFGVGLALLSPAAFAALEDVQTTAGKMAIAAFILVLVAVTIGVYFSRMQDKRRVPLTRLFEKRSPIHSVGPDTSVTECVRIMTAKKCGALIVMEGERLIGIFTERDALVRVLAGARDPVMTNVSEVMTKDPYCLAAKTTVGEAMAIVTKRRFRHLPIVENGKVVAIVSSGDLMHWLVKDKIGSVEELFKLAARP